MFIIITASIIFFALSLLAAYMVGEQKGFEEGRSYQRMTTVIEYTRDA